MIKSFRHRGVERFFRSGSQAGIQPKHAKRLRLQLGQLQVAGGPEDMNRPGWRCHPLKGALQGHWAVCVDENWRLTSGSTGSLPSSSITRISTEALRWHECTILRILEKFCRTRFCET
jgi:toxin HigB-1